jgi:CMP-N-acetylneuraminic acid synthetase
MIASKERYHRTLKVEYGLFNGKTRFILVTVQEHENGHYSCKLQIAGNYVTIFFEDLIEFENFFRCLHEAGTFYLNDINSVDTVENKTDIPL